MHVHVTVADHFYLGAESMLRTNLKLIGEAFQGNLKNTAKDTADVGRKQSSEAVLMITTYVEM